MYKLFLPLAFLVVTNLGILWFVPFPVIRTNQVALVASGKWSHYKFPDQKILSSKDNSLSCLVIGHQFRIRQNGDIKQVKINAHNIKEIKSLQIQVWRNNGGNFDLIGESKNLIDGLSNQPDAIFTLANPIKNVKEGDYYGFSVQGKSSHFSLASLNSDQVNTFCATDPTTTQFNWYNQNKLSDTAFLINLYMKPPEAVLIGDSIMG